jgi:hypothetical protein
MHGMGKDRIGQIDMYALEEERKLFQCSLRFTMGET